MAHDKIHALAHRAENLWDRARFRAKRATGLLGTPILLAYRGFQTPHGLWLRGRVIEDQGVISAEHSESIVGNMWLSLKRYETDEVRDARIAYSTGSITGEVTTDEEGYFDLTIEHPALSEAAPWLPVELILTEVPHYNVRPLGAKAEIRIVSPKARFGVISDIDDTIVKTGATNFLKHWRTVAANSAESRTAFPGVTHLYRGLAEGEAGPQTNPIFYVSSSPWNLFDLFERFMVLHDIPLGPMLLKDFGLDATKWLTGGHDDHKLTMIERVMAAHPQLPFVLVGDSGQRDAVIYAEAARRYPDRVLAVHIRDVTAGHLAQEADEGVASLKRAGVAVTVAPTLEEAAVHAAESGLARPSVLEEVRGAIEQRRREEGRVDG
ncbi:App1 family protein [Aurantimonas marina]|uniref:App1 family protein n=1 Tax=Aurantimonas marina TaxID=2780508 RepID=UPI0019D174CB|nr:phosphatase domain-containing protein [Aurantimonas marina]